MTEEERQEQYRWLDWLHDASWRWVRWSQPQPGWDHDHCLICNAHICNRAAHEDALRECWWYDYPDGMGNYETVCARCFSDLRATFRWTVIDTGAEPVAA